MVISGNIPFIDIHRHAAKLPVSADSERAVVIYNLTPGDRIPPDAVLFSAGIHPWDTEKHYSFRKLKEMAEHPNCIAIGECGLDKFTETGIEAQEDIFIRQIELSESLKKALIIHSVRAIPETVSLKKRLNPEMPWIIHGFRGKESKAQEFIQAGFYLSFGDTVVKETEFYQTFFRNLPADRLFLETDESETDIGDIYKSAAEMRDISIEKMKKIIFENYEKVFSR